MSVQEAHIESYCVGSLSLNMSGRRQVMVVSYASMQEFLSRKTTAENSGETPESLDANGFIGYLEKSLTAKDVSDMVRSDAFIWHVVLDPGMLVYVPLGFILAEKPLGEMVGMKYNVISITSAEGFQVVSSLGCPSLDEMSHTSRKHPLFR